MAKADRNSAGLACLAGLLITWLTVQAHAAGTPAGTVITNIATVTYKDANGNPLPAIRSNAVRTIVAQVAGVDVSPAAIRELVAAGAAVVFAAEVTNVGNGPDQFDLSVAGLPADWAGVVLGDANGNGVLDPEESAGAAVDSLSLGADESAKLLLVVQAPAAGEDGVLANAVLQAVSRFGRQATDAGIYTSVLSRVVVRIGLSAAPMDPRPGEVVLFRVRLANVGSAAATKVELSQVLPSEMLYVPGSLRYSANPADSYDAATGLSDGRDSDFGDFGASAPDAFTLRVDELAPGEEGVAYFQARVDEGLLSMVRIANQAKAVFVGAGETQEQATSPPLVLEVAARLGLLAQAKLRASSGEPSDLLWFPVEVINAGNVVDRFAAQANSARGFATQLWLDFDGDGVGGPADSPLVDTDADGVADTRRLAPGESADLLLGVTIAPGTLDGDLSTVGLSLVSGLDREVGEELIFEITVRAPNLFFEQQVSPIGLQPPGQTLTYTVVVTNQGTGTASNTVVRDAVPEFTTYVANSVTVDDRLRTDVSDTDEVVVKGREVVAHLGRLGPGGTQVVSFRVRID